VASSAQGSVPASRARRALSSAPQHATSVACAASSMTATSNVRPRSCAACTPVSVQHVTAAPSSTCSMHAACRCRGSPQLFTAAFHCSVSLPTHAPPAALQCELAVPQFVCHISTAACQPRRTSTMSHQHCIRLHTAAQHFHTLHHTASGRTLLHHPARARCCIRPHTAAPHFLTLHHTA
jgi:hypothetical protein